jgi:hypothetical protein
MAGANYIDTNPWNDPTNPWPTYTRITVGAADISTSVLTLSVFDPKKKIVYANSNNTIRLVSYFDEFFGAPGMGGKGWLIEKSEFGSNVGYYAIITYSKSLPTIGAGLSAQDYSGGNYTDGTNWWVVSGQPAYAGSNNTSLTATPDYNTRTDMERRRKILLGY